VCVCVYERKRANMSEIIFEIIIRSITRKSTQEVEGEALLSCTKEKERKKVNK
jgi:hypothetical protein